MRTRTINKLLLILTVLIISITTHAQNPVNWTAKQIMEPAALASLITAKKEVPVIISVGPGTTIPNSVDVGMVNNKEGLDKMRIQLAQLPRNKKIVIYCGCCPYEHCPNVRPAINVLKDLKFTNYYLLDLPHNIKKDWIEKGYPVAG